MKLLADIRLVLVAITVLSLASCVVEKPYTQTDAEAITASYKNYNFNPQIQLDTLNQFDSSGYRKGYWIEYIDHNGYPTDKSEIAQYYRYVYYIKGGKFGVNSIAKYPNITPPKHDNFWGVIKQSGRLRLTDSTHQLHKGAITLMNGTYLFYRNSKVICREDYSNGFLQVDSCFNRRGKIKWVFDCRRKLKGDPFSYRYSSYIRDTVMDYLFYRHRYQNSFLDTTVLDHGKKDIEPQLPPTQKYRHDSLQIPKGIFGSYCQNNIILLPSQLMEIISISPDAEKELQRARLSFYSMYLFMPTGVLLLTAGSGDQNGPNPRSPNIGLTIGGITSLAATIPAFISFKIHLKKAAKIYNRTVPNKK